MNNTVRPPSNVLTNRERDVLIYVARGLSNHEIAEQLCTSTSAVKVFLHQAYVKLRARNRAQAVINAIKWGALDTEEIYTFDELVELLAHLKPSTIQAIAELVKRQQDQLAGLLDSLDSGAVQAIARLANQRLQQDHLPSDRD